MDPAHFRQKGIAWWQREGGTPHDGFIIPALKRADFRRVLEIGPGRGALTFKVRDLGKDVVALDVNLEFIDYCRKRADCTNIDFFGGNAECLPFRDGAFDAVLCVEVLMHLPNPGKALREMARVTRPGGLIFVSFVKKYTRYHLKRLITVVSGVYEKRHGKGAFDYRYDSLSDIRRYISGSGLAITGISRARPENPCVQFERTLPDNA